MAGLDEELEALSAIFAEALTVVAPTHLSISMAPHDATLDLKLPEAYPDEAPGVSFASSTLPAAALAAAARAVQASTEDQLGEEMLFRIIEEARVELDAALAAHAASAANAAAEEAAPAPADPPSPKGESLERTSRKAQARKAVAAVKSATASARSVMSKSGGASDDSSSKKFSMRPATDVIDRIRWDGNLDSANFVVGYEDRFVGIIEKPFDAFNWADFSSLSHRETAIPKHRITHFSYRGVKVWDRHARIDNVFASTPGGRHLQDIAAEVDAELGDPAEEETTDDAVAAADADSASAAPQGEAAASVQPHKFANKDRPNYFVCLRCNASTIAAGVQAVQQSIEAYDSRVAEHFVPASASHITLVTMRLDTDAERQNAQRILGECADLLSGAEIHIRGLGAFRDRVVFGDVTPESRAVLTTLVAELLRRFREGGVRLMGNHDVFTPHMTIAKLSRAAVREFDHISGLSYASHASHDFGTQALSQIHLCLMSSEKADDGFYHRLASVPPFDDDNDGTATAGTITTAAAGGGGPTGSPRPVEAVLDEIERIYAKHGSVVVIMRGLPGSGKSTFIQELKKREALHRAVVCSADHFFEDKLYQRELVGQAHGACRSAFASALAAKESVVVVDNTNSTLREYKPYLDGAKEAKYRPIVVELACPSSAERALFEKRGLHNVPANVYDAMQARWYKDSRALLVLPHAAAPTTRVPRNQVVISSSEGNFFVAYTALFLTPESRKDLLARFPPAHPNVHAEHATICFAPTPAMMTTFPFGETVEIDVQRVVQDDKGHAVLVTVADSHRFAFRNSYPHITISTAKDIPPAYSNELLAEALRGSQHLDSGKPLLHLTATAGLATRDRSAAKFFNATRFFEFLSSRALQQSRSVSSEPVITTINVFDFDGTLFETTGPELGKTLYWKAFGRTWPHTGFVTHPESLEAPMPVTPGPILPHYASHYRRHGALTVVLSGRISALQPQVEQVMARFGLAADAYLLKPDAASSTAEFKCKALDDLLRQYPAVKTMRIWEDLPENLEAMRAWATAHLKVDVKITDSIAAGARLADGANSTKSGRAIYPLLRARGCLPWDRFSAAAGDAIDLVQRIWGAVLYSNRVAAPAQGSYKDCSRVFGSFALGRHGDVDLCLLADDSATHWQWLVRLRESLSDAGVLYVYFGDSELCPRVSIRLEMTSCHPIELDIVLARLPAAKFSELCGARAGKVLSSVVDDQSRVAFEGVRFVEVVRKHLDARSIKLAHFALAVEFMVQFLTARALRGNAFHCPRTYHITSLALLAIQEAPVDAALDSPERLLAQMTVRIVLGGPALLSSIFKDFVPEAFVVPFLEAVADLHAKCLGEATEDVFSALLQPSQFPPDGHVAVVLAHTDTSPVAGWCFHNWLRARLGAHTRALQTAGVDVHPHSCATPGTFAFAVPAEPACKMAVIDRLSLLWKEFGVFTAQGISATLHVDGTQVLGTGAQPLADQFRADAELLKQVSEFAENAKVGDELALPASLDGAQRKLVHSHAGSLGLEHESQGKGANRHLVLTKVA
eukprot:m.3329 g.3329  ORF g.3329 m.3329 type:complete len:1539 (-) comp2296_c0_seq1:46-4662(-)